MDLFGGQLPRQVKHRFAYGINFYDLGQVLQTTPGGRPLLEQVYHGIYNLEISKKVQVPHEMLLVMNPSQIFEVYTGSWRAKMDEALLNEAVMKSNFWQVVSAVRHAVKDDYQISQSLQMLDKLCGKTYAADEDGDLPKRLRALPPSAGTQFMEAFTYPFRTADPKAGYLPVNKLKMGLDEIIFGYFVQKYAEGERQLSLSTS